MTERYTLYDIGLLRERYTLPEGLPKGIKPSYSRKPGFAQPVVLLRGGVRKAERMIWGFLPDHAKNTNSIFRFKTYNVRSEIIFTKPSTSDAIRTQRCLVPVNGFYQWKKTEEGMKAHYITRTDGKIFSLAGVYSSWKKPDGEIQNTFSVITCESNDDLSDISNRMPVVVHPDDETTWINPEAYDATTLFDIMRPCPNGVLSATQVSPAVATSKSDTKKLIDKVEG